MSSILTPDFAPEFSGAATALAGALGAYLLLVEPWLGRRMYASLARRRASEPRALVRYFTLSISLWWAFAALAVTTLLLSPDARATDFGMALPEDPLFFVPVVLLFAAIAVASGRAFRDMAKEGKHIPGRAAIEAMLPRTGAERRLAIAAAVTDGICAELVYRGLLIAFGVGALGLDPYLAAALALAVYALAGWYQGGAGIVVLALFGALLTGLYLATGSLLLPIAVHAMISVRDLLIPAPELPRTQGGTA
ncbi:CPBP family glutamic-type intramembrane protease [Streptomyces flavofungini]|uniref:CPBP family glutamic-type intramembrane protease n=1 Tax=Streptomyces flavofungini TaxID=68200 RepID=UPI0025AF61F8|nr:CPBP family glutamic-type intramembrane protease [Streptomyces flavofungini]WJV49551.1 CPBP family glutamic-type intramembrane protease [Streptomyces flavofungini]